MGILDKVFKKRSTTDDVRPDEPAVAAETDPSAAPAATVEPPPTSSPAPTTNEAGATASGTAEPAPPAMPPGWDWGSLTAPPPPAASEDQGAIGIPDPERTAELKPYVIEAISTVFDPEIPVNIYELGLIYEIAADVDSRVHIRMTLTSPACPSAQQLPSEVRYKVKEIPGVSDATVEIVWEPPWSKDKMSEEARLSLGLF